MSKGDAAFLTFVACGVALIIFGLGMMCGNSNRQSDCDDFGHTKMFGKIYECHSEASAKQL